MRSFSLIFTMLVAGCAVRVPQTPALAISIKGKARVPAPVVHVEGHVEGQVEGEAVVEEPPPPPEPVAIVGAEVVEFFGIPLDGADNVVFVLDISGSMADAAPASVAAVTVEAAPPSEAPPLEAAPPPEDTTEPESTTAPPPSAAAPSWRKIDVAQAELIDALERIPAGTNLNIIFFHSDLEGVAANLFPLDDARREELIAYVDETEPTGSTALAPAMRTALVMGASRIVLLSDGLGNVGGGSSVVLRDAREAIRGGVRIDTIGLGNDQDASLLQALADESGGIYQPL